MKLTKYIITLLLILFVFGCMKDDKLAFYQSSYTGNQLRIDGFYYQQCDKDYCTIYCFYRNGVLLYLGNYFTPDELTNLKSTIIDGSFYNSVKDKKDNWGSFKITNSNIEFQKWESATKKHYTAYDYSGDIINDTTFTITRYMRVNKTGMTKVEQTYVFMKFSPKPDSTNSFVK
ncbi:MAG: hypothetical protein PHD97_12245 [Bacteroidales bacterium]|nr:hypothetical protein [Bacteroidales bacterium]